MKYMHKIVTGAFKALLTSTVLLIVSITLLYIVQILNVTYRVSAIAQSMQTDISRNNCLTPNSAKMFNALLQGIAEDFGGDESGDNISGSTVVYTIGFNCNNDDLDYDDRDYVDDDEGADATEAATHYAQDKIIGGGAHGVLSSAKLVDEVGDYDKDEINVITSTNVAGQYGDISILNIRVTYNALTWFGSGQKSARFNRDEASGKEGISRGFTRYNMDFTYAVPLLKYITVEE